MSKPWFRRKASTGGSNRKYGNNIRASFIEDWPNYGYPGYKLYFREKNNCSQETLKHIECFLKFIENNKGTYNFKDMLHHRYFNVEYSSLLSDDDIASGWPDIKEEIINNTEHCIKCMGLAMHSFLYRMKQNESNKEEIDVGTVYARIINFEPVLQLKNLGVNYYGKLVTIKSTVIRAGNAKLFCKYLAFSCHICNGTQLMAQKDGTLTPPTSCSTTGCRTKSQFIPLINSPFNEIITWQNLRIQELLRPEMCDDARVPRTLDCELTEDMVRSCIPGDDITVTGVIKVRNSQHNCNKNKQQALFNMYLEVVSIFNNKKHSSSNNSSGRSTDAVVFNTKDYYLIKAIHSEPNLFRLLVQSMCPHIYGHDIVKAGLLLALLGGTKSDTFRAESHVLLVGDPGLGKSQMLKACTNVAPRGVYVCGNTSTSSGLTVTVTRDGNDFALEAGALMLADQGCCCIDEFDKSPAQHACLLEAMEQQSISVAKAGIVCNLPTRTTVLAAANPAGGHYNKAKTIAENLRISSPTLSRFDLIFVLLDHAEEHLDSFVTKHVLRLHVAEANKTTQNGNTSFSGPRHYESLRERLKLMPGEKIDHIPHILLRKYIAYAHKYVKPHLTEEARILIKDFYITLRQRFQYGDSTPITTRQLNSLIRLTQARAKAELREEATQEDAAEVIEIMNSSLSDIFTDNNGLLDRTRSQNSTGMSTRNKAMKLLTTIQQCSETEAKSMFTMNEIIALGEQVGLNKNKVFELVESLNIQGFLLNKGQRRYQLVSATT